MFGKASPPPQASKEKGSFENLRSLADICKGVAGAKALQTSEGFKALLGPESAPY